MKTMLATTAAVVMIASAAGAQDFGLDTVRIGVGLHDAGILTADEEDGADIGLEARIRTPEYLGPIFTPKPTAGVTIDTGGETNFYYGGLTWTLPVDPIFVDLFFGVTVHDGDASGTKDPGDDNKELGCRVLFREGVEIGVTFMEHHQVSALFTHSSHGDIFCSGRNPGMDHVGLRYGYKF